MEVMPRTNPEKNRENVKKSNEKKKSQLGEEEYNLKKYFAENEGTYRTDKKEKIGVEEYKKQQAEYMKEYRAKKKQEKGQQVLLVIILKHQKLDENIQKNYQHKFQRDAEEDQESNNRFIFMI